MPHILIAGSIHESGIKLLRGRKDFTYDYLSENADNSYVEFLENADALIIRVQPLVRTDIEKATSLKIVSRHGVGYDTVDLDALSERGILLTVVGDVNSQSVAEHSMALLLAASKRLIKNDFTARSNSWGYKNKLEPEELCGKNLLILGFGRIGKRVARIATSFGMEVIVYDPFVDSKTFFDESATQIDNLEKALSMATHISINMPGTKKPLLNAREFELMRDGVIIVNTARGNIINETDMIEALRNGKIAAAGLDVFNEEPPAKRNVFSEFDQVVLTPHIAGLSREAAEAMSVSSVQNVIDYFDGRLNPLRVVNKENLKKNENP